MTNKTPPTISTTSPSSPHSSPSSRPASPTRGLRRPASHGRLAQLMLPERARSSSSASASNETAYADETSPASSGRTTPEQRRRTGKAAATSLLASDAKYKKFAGMIDKSLASFESVNEWADFISFLSRLLKTLQTPSPPYTEIPRKLVISKRLAQCLNPALPSGVHQRALDVYNYVFTTIGAEGLRRDLLIWSSGLLPFFQYAATSVRPLLIDLYERYYLPLGEDLRPATKALILALLPALEEETGDFFDRVYSLFGKLSTAISPAFFLQNIFLTLISNPSSRLAALNYLAKSFVKPPETIEDKSDIGLIVRGVAAALQDENMLVRRHGLDLSLRILPLDGTILSECDVMDRELVVRSACGVVLQRELSLSRRVYTWFLGKEESPEKQMAYFRTYGLDLLAGVLQADMDRIGADTQLHEAQKPFKIFLSLLDRWEIGAALSDKVVMHALDAIRIGLPKVAHDMREEMLDTATAVYEAVEPIVIWRALFALIPRPESERTSSAEVVSWVVSSLRQNDEEVLNLHVPLVLNHILELLLSARSQHPNADLTTLAARLLRLVPPSFFERPADGPTAEPGKGDVAWVDRVYGTAIPDLDAVTAGTRDAVPASIVAQALQLHSNMMSTAPVDEAAFLTVTSIVGTLIDVEASALMHVQERAWLGRMLKLLPNTSSFPAVDAIVSVVLQASRSSIFAARLQLAESAIISTILSALLHFLRPQNGCYHTRAVELIWECNQVAEPHTLENEVSQQLADPIRHPHAQAAFGTLWRLTDDAMQPGELFFTPVISILDNLKSPDSLVRRSAEQWIRQNFGSYFRILDPLLARLQSVQGDHDTAMYLLDIVTCLLRFGSDDLRRMCEGTRLKQSSHSAISKRSEADDRVTYFDFIIDTAASLLKLGAPSSTRHSQSGTHSKAVTRIHSAALELLHFLLESSNVPETTLVAVRDCVISELRHAIRQHQLLLQPQMLSVLRLCLVANTPIPAGHARKRSQVVVEKSSLAHDTEPDLAVLQVIVEGVSSPQNRAMLQPWIEFILAISPTVASRHSMMLVLCECLSDQIRRSLLQLRTMYQVPDAFAVADSEPMLLLVGLETLLTLVFAARKDTRTSEEQQRSQSEGGGSGIMGLMSGVFTVEAPSNEKMTDSIQYLDDAINALLLTWSVTSRSYSLGSASTSESSVMARTKGKARTVLDRLFKAVPTATIGSCIQVWAAHAADIDDEAIFDCIDNLAPSAQRVVDIIAEAVTGRQGKDKNTDISSDPSLLGFLEVYVSRLEAPIAVQIWSTLFSFARDILGSSSPSSKAQLYPVLRCVTIVCKTVSTTSALEDRRLRRDLQDVYLKLLDGVVTNVTRSAESALWHRDLPTTNPNSTGEKGGEADHDGLRAVHGYVAQIVIPNLRSFLSDNDKVASAASTISAGLLQPAFRRQRVDSTVLQISLELTKLPSATKAWRLQVGEAFNDQRFFKIDPSESADWKPLICALMDSDRERFGELLARITAAPSSNIFTNREQEMISRSLNLRRLSFVLLAAERNHYLAQLPSIQEKLVDILRSDIVSPRVHSEVYLCLRVLMCRISPQHLTNFWPVILTELLKVFESTMDDPPADGSEDLALVLAACKFLDLLLIIQSEDFQIHQWMFVTDTTDAAFPPEDFVPEAIMDRLSEILSEHSHGRRSHDPVVLDGYDEDQRNLRRPRLTTMKHLDSLAQLQTFFARASIDTFEGVYNDQGTDWDAVESGLDHEIFDTR